MNILDKQMASNLSEQNYLYSLWERGGSTKGNSDKLKIIGSHIDHIYTPDNFERVIEKYSDPDLKLITLTITESGYGMDVHTGVLNSEFYKRDIEQLYSLINDTRSVCSDEHLNFNTAIGQIVFGLYWRKKFDKKPVTVLSCDNIQENGLHTKNTVLKVAEGVDSELSRWIENNISFPNSMVDRITPRTTSEHINDVSSIYGIEDKCPVICEDFTQWVIEDNFVNEKPPLDEEENVLFVNDVLPYELMKLRLLNASHQVIAYIGILMGYRYIHDAMLDKNHIAKDFLELYMKLIATTIPKVKNIEFDTYISSLLDRYNN
eukprot:UN31200